ncbi:hypothetical protein V5799_012994, partial [Amblyomma americanum]
FLTNAASSVRDDFPLLGEVLPSLVQTYMICKRDAGTTQSRKPCQALTKPSAFIPEDGFAYCLMLKAEIKTKIKTNFGCRRSYFSFPAMVTKTGP